MGRAYLKDKDILRLLRKDVAKAGSQLAWSQKHGYDRTVLNVILSGGRPVLPKVCELLNLRTAYVRDIRQDDLAVLEDEDVLNLLRADIARVGGQSAWARIHEHERSHVNRVLAGKKPITPEILRRLGLKRVYVRKP
jgi:hypothetical protein